jgi:voltage-gated potassium channel
MTRAHALADPTRAARPGSTRRALSAKATAHRYGLVLVLLLATFLVLVCGLNGAWVRPITVSLEGATLLAALSAAETPVRLQRLARSVVLVCILASLFTITSDTRSGTAEGAVLSGLLVASAPIAIGQSIVRRKVVDIRTVLGALCIYVLIGMLWAYIFAIMGSVGSRPFFAQQVHANAAQYTYFSFVTLTTVGYGDLTAATNVGRGFAVLEALLGQIYLVTVVAVLVSNLASSGGHPFARDA